MLFLTEYYLDDICIQGPIIGAVDWTAARRRALEYAKMEDQRRLQRYAELHVVNGFRTKDAMLHSPLLLKYTHECDQSVCLGCAYHWVAIYPLGAEDLECPRCGVPASIHIT